MSDKYNPPSGKTVSLNFGSATYTPPVSYSVRLEFSSDQAEPSEDQYLFPQSCESGDIGSASVILATLYASPYGIPRLGLGVPHAYLYNSIIKPPSFTQTRYGRPFLLNWNKTIYP